MRAHRRHLSVVLAGAAICLTASAFWFMRSPYKPHPTAIDDIAPVDGALVDPYTTRRLRWAVGESRRYKVVASSTLRVNPGAMLDVKAQTGAQALRVDLEGNFQLDVIGEMDGCAIVRGALEPTKIRVEASEQGVIDGEVAMRGRMHELLATPIVLRISSSGSIEGIRVPPTLTHEQNIFLAIKQIPAAMQVVFPTSPGMRRWEAMQEDVTGKFLAAYSLDGNTVAIDKRAYTSVATERGSLAVGAELEVRSRSTMALELEDAGWTRTSNVLERLSIKYGGPQTNGRTAVTASSEGELTISQIGFEPRGATDTGVEGWRDLKEFPLSHVYSQEQVDTDPRALSDLLYELRASLALGSEEARTREAAALMQAIAKKARRDPAAVAALAEKIRREGAREVDEAGVLIGALGTAGTPAAQKALDLVITDPQLPTQLHIQAITQLAFVKSPTDDTVSTVEAMTRSNNDEEQTTSTLVLGAIARSMRDESPEAAAGQVQLLIDRYEKSTSLGEKMLLLSALGNSGTPEALPVIFQALASDIPGLRLEAVRALRFMAPGPADQAIDSILAKDPSADVRKAAVFALGFRDLKDHVSIVGTVLSRDTDPTVRVALVGVLVAAIHKYPPALAILKSVSVADPDEDVRKAAASFAQSAQLTEGTIVAATATVTPPH